MEYEVDIIKLQIAITKAGFKNIKAFAAASGINRNTIASVINGKKRPSSIVIEKISRALKLSSYEIGTIFFSIKLTQNAS